MHPDAHFVPCCFSSEVVGRPLAALLANDGARVFSVDIDSIQEYTKRPTVLTSKEKLKYHTAHIVHPSNFSLQECLALSDVVISAVPSAAYKVKTEELKMGCICVNVASEKNFETNVRERVSETEMYSKVSHIQTIPYPSRPLCISLLLVKSLS